MKSKLLGAIIIGTFLTVFSACSEEEITPIETTTSDQMGSERDGDGF